MIISIQFLIKNQFQKKRVTRFSHEAVDLSVKECAEKFCTIKMISVFTESASPHSSMNLTCPSSIILLRTTKNWQIGCNAKLNLLIVS